MVEPMWCLAANSADVVAFAFAGNHNDTARASSMCTAYKSNKSLVSLLKCEPMKIDAAVDRHFTAFESLRCAPIHVARGTQD